MSRSEPVERCSGCVRRWPAAALTTSYPELRRRFPEALADPEHRDVWVYLTNPYGVDLCSVVNEDTGAGDWSGYFEGHRLHPGTPGGPGRAVRRSASG